MKRMLKNKNADVKRRHLHVKKGDMVCVINGKNKGLSGKVVEVSVKESKVIVEGVNISKKHLKPRQQGMAGSIVNVESPLYSSKVMLVCPKCKQRTRTSYANDEKGQKKRVCKKCSELF